MRTVGLFCYAVLFVASLACGGCMTSYSRMSVNGKPLWVYVDSYDSLIIQNNIEGTVLGGIKGGGWYSKQGVDGVPTGGLVSMPINPWGDVADVEVTANVYNLDNKLIGVARAVFDFRDKRVDQHRFGDPPRMWLVSQYERVMTLEEAARPPKISGKDF